MRRICAFLVAVIVLAGAASPAHGSGLTDIVIGEAESFSDSLVSVVSDVGDAFSVAVDGALLVLRSAPGVYDALKGHFETVYNSTATPAVVRQVVGTWLHNYARDHSIADIQSWLAESTSDMYCTSDGTIYFGENAVGFYDELLGWVWDDPSGPRLVDSAQMVPSSDIVDFGDFRASLVSVNIPCVSEGKFVSSRIADVTNSSGEPYSGQYRGFIAAEPLSFYIGLVRIADNPNAYNIYFMGESVGTNRFTYQGIIYYSDDGTITSTYPATSQRLVIVADDRWRASSWNWAALSGLTLPINDNPPNSEDVTPAPSGELTPVGNPHIFSGLTSAAIDAGELVTVSAPDQSGNWFITPHDFLNTVNNVTYTQAPQTTTILNTTDNTSDRVTVSPVGTPEEPAQPPISYNPVQPEEAGLFKFLFDWGESSGIAPFQTELRDIFPFCIPFDIYALFEKLAVDPVAPAVDWPIKVEALGLDSTFTLDLSPLDSVAAVSRTAQKVALIIGLVFLTKELIG